MRSRVVALAALLAVAACGGGAGDDAAAPSTTTASTPATAERIVPVNGDLAEVVYALGLGDQVVGTDISATYPDAAQHTPKIGYQRTLVAETILAHDPTVVLADDNAGPPEVLAQLEAAGVRVERFPKEETIDAPARKVREVATALGVPQRGEEVVATLDAQLEAAGKRADAAVAATGRPKVLALYLRGPNVQLAFGQGSGIDAVITAAGGTDAGTEMGVVDNAELSIESIIKEAPDVLLVTTTGLESVGGIDALLTTPGIDQTPAAANRRVVAFEDQYLYGLGPRTGELVGELVTAFHPMHPPHEEPSMGRALLTLTIAGSLALAACGGDDDAAATTTKPAATTTTAAPAAGGYVPGADPDADAAALAWTTVFDSSLAYDAKAAHIADATALKATIDAYTQAGQAVGGIALVPTAVVVTGDTAAITYDVTFAGQPAYQAQEGTIQRAGDTWQVGREELCGFMAAARNPCPAG